MIKEKQNPKEHQPLVGRDMNMQLLDGEQKDKLKQAPLP
jgi:hypothetical protein